MNKKIGIMGGTFDPPHIGHLTMAEFVRKSLNLSEIWFIPTGKIPHKSTKETASAFHRLNMVKLAVEGNDNFFVNDTEVVRDSFSYTFETLEELKGKYPDIEFTFIVGADSLDYMEKWKEPQRIFRCCKIAAVNRPGISNDKIAEKKKMLGNAYNGVIEIINMPPVDVSSTQIRKMIREGKSVTQFVPEKVIEYIKHNNIYKD